MEEERSLLTYISKRFETKTAEGRKRRKEEKERAIFRDQLTL